MYASAVFQSRRPLTFAAIALYLPLLAGCGERVKPNARNGEKTDRESRILDVAKSLEARGAELTAGGSDVRVKAVKLTGPRFGDPAVEMILALKGLQVITLVNTGITPNGVARLANLESLRAIDARGAQVDDQALIALARLPKLDNLKVTGEAVTDEGAAALLNKPERGLRVLGLDGTSAGQKTVDELFLRSKPSTSQLKEVYLADCPITKLNSNQDAVVQYLTKLRLAGCGVGGTDMQALITSRITDLDVSRTRVDDDAVASLAAMPELAKLNLYDTAVTGANLGQFARRGKLVWLNIDKTQVTDASLPQVAQIQSLTWLHLGRCDVTDDGIQVLAALENLQALTLTRTQVTRAGATTLKESLPACEITIGDPDTATIEVSVGGYPAGMGRD